MPLSDVLGLGAGLLQVVGYLLYVRRFAGASIRPNAASWIMFGYGTGLLVALEISNGGTWQILALPAVCAVMSIVVAALCLRPGATDPIMPIEKTVFGADIVLTIAFVAAVMGWAFQSISSTMFLVLGNVTTLTAFLPILFSTWNSPDREEASPWVVWSLAYTLLFAATLWADRGANPQLLIYPVLSLVLHATMAALALWKETYSDEDLQVPDGFHAAKSAIAGTGIFASRGFEAGELISVLRGQIVRGEKPSHSGPNWIGLGKQFWIDPVYPFNLVNHSCNPSARFSARRQLVALRPIEPGEEITFDYSTTEVDPGWSMACACKSANCRLGLHALQISFADSDEPPPAGPLMQLLWRKHRKAPSQKPLFRQLFPLEGPQPDDAQLVIAATPVPADREPA